MGQQVTLTLNESLYNAGLLGLIRIFEEYNLPFEIKEHRNLQFNTEILKDFTAHYLETLIRTFRSQTVYEEIMNRYVRVQTLHFATEEEQSIFDECVKYIEEKMKRASYKSGFEIIKERGEAYDFSTACKTIKGESAYSEKKKLLEIFITKLKQYEDVFILKDITYTKIEPFWASVAFLNSKNNKREFHDCFEESFTTPAHIFVPKEGKKGNLYCCQCSAPITKSTGFAMSWVNDVGVDVNRKTSYYWDFQVDSFLCPVCNLVYACIPLGFTMKGSEGIFINANDSINVLRRRNVEPEERTVDRKDDLLYRVVERFINESQNTVAREEINNIQVIRRSNNRYIFNVLSKEKLRVIKDCEKEFSGLVGLTFKVQDQYIQLYRETLQRLLSGVNLYFLIHQILYTAVENGQRLWFVRYLLIIQSSISVEGKVNMSKSLLDEALDFGSSLRNSMLSNNQNENKVRALSYKLLNALKVRNANDFMDTILRNYIGLGLQMPSHFLEVLKNESRFLGFGYAFLTGLNGGAVKKDEGDEQV